MSVAFSSSNSMSAVAHATMSQSLQIQEDSVVTRLMDICNEKYESVPQAILDEVTQIYTAHKEKVITHVTDETGEKKDSPFYEAFFAAVLNGSLALVQRMQQLVSANEIMLDSNGWSAFHHLSTLSDEEFDPTHVAVLRYLFDSFPEELFSENGECNYPVFIACQANKFSFLKELFQLYGNDVQFQIQVLKGLSLVAHSFWTSEHEKILEEIVNSIEKSNPKLFSAPSELQRYHLEQRCGLSYPLMTQAYISGNSSLVLALEKLGYASYATERDTSQRNILQCLCSLLPSEIISEHQHLFLKLLRSNFELFEESLSTSESVPYAILRFGNKRFLEAFREYFPDKRERFAIYFTHPSKNVYPIHDFFKTNPSFVQEQSRICADIVQHQKATLSYLCEVCSPRVFDKVKDSQNATALSYALKQNLYHLIPDAYYKNPDPSICFRLLMTISESSLQTYLSKLSQAKTLMHEIQEGLRDPRVQNANTPLEQYQRAFFIRNFLPFSRESITCLVNTLSDTCSESFALFLVQTINAQSGQISDRQIVQVLSLWRTLIVQSLEKDKPVVRKGLRAVLVAVIKIPELVNKKFDFSHEVYGGFRFFLPKSADENLLLMDQEFLKGGSVKQFAVTFQFKVTNQEIVKVSLIAAQQMRANFYQSLTKSNLDNMISNIETLSKCPHIQQAYKVHHVPKHEFIVFTECYVTDLDALLRSQTLFSSSPCTSPKDFVQALIIVRNIFLAMEYMHRQMKIHWDIKPLNVFVRRINGIYFPVLGDLDFVQEITRQGELKDKKYPILYNLYGTLGYSSPQLRSLAMSPQTTSDQNAQTPPPGGYMAHDIWAVAMLFGSVFTGHDLEKKIILTEDDHSEMMHEMRTKFDQVEASRDMVDNKYKPLVGQCYDLFCSLAAYTPESRCSISDALKVVTRILPQAYKNLPSEQDKALFGSVLEM